MNRLGLLGVAGAVLLSWPIAASAADKGKIIYAAGNCFVIQTDDGVALFERSGGKSPEVDTAVSGVLSDFGYQQLYNAAGKELMVGFVQEYGVKKEKNIADFKKSCR
jgi:hypothetical protein